MEMSAVKDKPLFDEYTDTGDPKEYTLKEIVEKTKFSDDHIRKELKRARIKAKLIGNAKRNNARFYGKDLNTVFPVKITTYT